VIVGLYEGSKSFLSPKKKDLKWFHGGSGAPADVIFDGVAGHKTNPRLTRRTSPRIWQRARCCYFPTASRFISKPSCRPKRSDVILVAPKGPWTHRPAANTPKQGRALVDRRLSKSEQAGEEVALAWAKASAPTRAGVLGNDLQEETETDLFGEQDRVVRWFDRY